MVFRKKRFEWVQFDLQISIVTEPMFTSLFSPNAGGIAADQALVRF